MREPLIPVVSRVHRSCPHLARLLYTLALHRVPTRLIAFARFAQDHDYCVAVLAPVLPEVSPEGLATASDAVVRPALLHLP